MADVAIIQVDTPSPVIVVATPAPTEIIEVAGRPGPSNTLTIGSVITGAAGSSASATLTGTAPNQVLNLTIPQGASGSLTAHTHLSSDISDASGSSLPNTVVRRFPDGSAEFVTAYLTTQAVDPAAAVRKDYADAKVRRAVNAPIAADYTLAASDEGKLLYNYNNVATVVRLPLEAAVAIPVGAWVDIMRGSDGPTTVVPASGVTLLVSTGVVGSASIRSPFGAVRVYKNGPNLWSTSGDIVTAADTAVAEATADATAGTIVRRETGGLGFAAGYIYGLSAPTNNDWAANKGYSDTNDRWTPVFKSGAAYTFALGDEFDHILSNDTIAQTFTIPTNATAAFPLGAKIRVTRWQTGSLTIAAAGGVSLVSNTTSRALNQYDSCLIVKVATDSWLIVDLEVTATESIAGAVELATAAEVVTGTDNTRAVHPAGLAGLTSNETRRGLVELATAAETTTGTDNTRAVHPQGLKVELDKKAPVTHTHVIGDLTATGTKDATTFLRGDGTWALPPAAAAPPPTATGSRSILQLFKIQLPSGVDGSADEKTPAQLMAGYRDAYFSETTDGRGFFFHVPVDGATTSGTTMPRSELREVNEDGSNAAWTASATETRIFEATYRILHLPPVDRETTLFQIHNGNTEVTTVRTTETAGGIRVAARKNGTSITPYFDTNYQYGTDFRIRVEIDTNVKIYYNGTLIHNYPFSDLTVGTGFYIKWGNYLQTDETTSAPTEYGDVEVRDVLFVKNGKSYTTGVLGHTHAITDIKATGTKDATTFLRGDGTWAVPPGGSGGGTVTAANITDATAIGRTVLTSVDGPAVRTAIGAGTSSLAIGTTSTTAKAGDYAPADASTAVKGIVQLTNHLGGTATAPTVRASSETQTGIVELATAAETTTGTDATRAVHPQGLKVELDKKAALSHNHTAANISDSTATGRSVLTATDAAAARSAISTNGVTGGITMIEQITQAAYDALGTKVATTLYVIVG